jgi:glycosyltransferase involved in cell wall biosynthesis
MYTKDFMPKVSIIIPVYNGSNYLKEAIESALAQTYKNIEIIVINDGSNDNGATEKIAKSYGNKIRYYSKKNGGVATALNLGISKMKGEYFSWLSHDDMYYPKKVERQINFLSRLKNKKVFLYSNFSILLDDEIIPVIHNHEMLTRKKKYGLLRGCVNGITVLIPKTVIDEMGKFDASLRCTQDYDYWRRIEKKYEFVHMEEILSITRLHSAQDSASQTAIDEGNVLWIDMIKSLQDKEKIKLEGTLYNFYFEMVKFLKTTPYDKTLEYCKGELKIIEKKLNSISFNPKVSIIIPFYNSLANTMIALESAVNQSHNNIEILLIDDHSNEDIGRVKEYIKDKKNIKLISQKNNQGPAAARNRGIKEATGEYIAFLDSDDEFSHEKIKEQLEMMDKHNKNFSYTSYIQRSNEGDTIIGDSALTGIAVPRIISSCSIATPTVMLKRSLMIDNGIFFNEKIRVGEDTCLWLELAKITEILFINRSYTIVNVNSNSHSRDLSKQLVGIQNILTYLLNDEYYEKYIHDISLMCKNYNHINNELENTAKESLSIPDYILSENVAFNKSTTDLENEINRLNNEINKIYGSRRWRYSSKAAKARHLKKIPNKLRLFAGK